jgi:hypothetical protein
MSRARVFKITNEDDPLDYEYPRALTLAQIRDADDETADRAAILLVGESFPVGGGAAPLFRVRRIR